MGQQSASELVTTSANSGTASSSVTAGASRSRVQLRAALRGRSLGAQLATLTPRENLQLSSRTATTAPERVGPVVQLTPDAETPAEVLPSPEATDASPGPIAADRDEPPDGLDVADAIDWYQDTDLYEGDAGAERMAVVLQTLGLTASDARVSDDGAYDVTERFVIRAAWWQIDQGLGLTPDGCLGRSALVRLGFDPSGTSFAVWNANDLRSGEVDPRLEQLFELDTFMTRCLQVITSGGTAKRFGDVTGDDGIAVGIQHLTGEDAVAELIELMAQTLGEDVLLESFFGTEVEGRTVDDIIAMLGLDVDGGDNDALSQIATSVNEEAFLRLFSDPRFQDVQVEYFRQHHLSSGVTQGREIAGDGAKIGTMALCVCVGNSNTHALDGIGSSDDELAAQLTIGRRYAAERPSEPRDSEVGPVFWARLHDNRSSGGAGVDWQDVARETIADLPDDTEHWSDIVSKSPPHTCRRLRNLVQYFGDVWDRPFQSVDAAAGGSGEVAQLEMPDLDAPIEAGPPIEQPQPEPQAERRVEPFEPIDTGEPSQDETGPAPEASELRERAPQGDRPLWAHHRGSERGETSPGGAFAHRRPARATGDPQADLPADSERGEGADGAGIAAPAQVVEPDEIEVAEPEQGQATPVVSEIPPVPQQRLVLDTPNFTRTGETIVHIPADFDPTAPVEVLVHLHGHNFEAGDDVERYQLDTNLQGSGRNMIAVLPVGSSDSRYAPSGSSFDTDGLVDEVLRQLAAREPTWGWQDELPPVEHLVLSGSSGAGNSLHTGDRAPITDAVDELVLMDTLNRQGSDPNQPVISPQTEDAVAFVQERIALEIDHMADDLGTNEERLTFLEEDGFRLQVYYSTDEQYTERALHLEAQVAEAIARGRGRFEDPDPVLERLASNYRFHAAGVSHGQLVGASLDDALAADAPSRSDEAGPVAEAAGEPVAEAAVEPVAEANRDEATAPEASSATASGPLSASEEMQAILYNRGDTEIGAEARESLLHPAWVQRMQRFIGVSEAHCRGHFDRETVQCLARWQSTHGLNPRGRVDADTYAALVTAGCDDADIALEELDLHSFSVRDMTNEQYRSGRMTDEAESSYGARSDADVRNSRLRDAGEGGWPQWAAEIQRCSFLGRRVRGHRMLRDRLAIAQAYIMQQPKFAGMTPAEVGQLIIKEDIKDLRHDAKYHGYGLAIDINYETNPWIGGQHTDNSKYSDNDRDALSAIWRAVWLTGQGSPISPTDSRARARTETTEEMIAHFAGANAALERYFEARDDERLLADLVARWDREAPPPLPSGLRLDVDPATLAGLDVAGWRRRITADWESTHHTDEANWQKDESYRSDAGFFDIASILVIALRDAAGMAWGASDFEGEASGDFMHFDCRTSARARACVEG